MQASSKNYYLDCGGENFISPDSVWCEYAFWKNIYGESILDEIPQGCQNNVIGAFVAVWTEQIDDATIISRIFPRAFGLAERLWSDPSQKGTDKDIDMWLPALKRLRVFNQNVKN